ncbi:YjzD family protein [Ligilactobacillus equi]|uniref:Integral membrane protein n=2 Tax=Ligilactobacillus equi TaxID=137357 RepID=V7HV99_9LACO|nr:DUF2929 family protein [Ligilactobacillus equi]ETA73190.1 hypothetical protein LEQ_2195c [Ligilactobacillus equi DPC 6820]MCQ2557009.1 YjzD family protein [Ligilactobacillus sp.]
MKHLTAMFWGAIYGEVLGFLVSSLTGEHFTMGISALIPAIAGWLFVALVQKFIDTPAEK